MKRILISIFTLFSSVLIISCSGSQDDANLSPVSIKEIKDRVNKNSSVLETLEASGNISFDSPDNSGSGWLELKIKRPDSVYVKIEGPFGISIANALITRNDFTYYNVQENKVITGPSSDINIGAVLRIKVSFDDLINGFTGSFKLDESDNDSSAADVEKNSYLIKNAKNNDIEKFYIEPGLFRLMRYNLVNTSYESLVEVDYSNYGEENVSAAKIFFPNSIKIKNPQKSQSVYIDFVSKEINKKDISFRMKIPKSAKVVKWN